MKNTALPMLSAERRPGLSFRAPHSALAKFDASVNAAAKQSDGEIAIMGEIGPSEYGYIGAEGIKAALDAIGKAPVLVLLNSPGGDAFEGIAIYNLLRMHPGKITVKVLGVAASAASVIAMAGDNVQMGAAATLMIHSAWGLVVGNQQEMRDFADTLDMLDKSVAKLYAARSGLLEKEVLAMMQKETWMSADDAVSKGFADVALADTKKKAQASAPNSIQARAPVVLLAAPGDRQHVAARMSTTPPGASGYRPSISQGTDMPKPLAEQISAFESKRAANAARMDAIMSAAADAGSTLDDAQTEEYDTLDAEIKQIDGHLVRLKAHEVRMVAAATEVTPRNVVDPESGAGVRSGQQNSGIISVRQNVAQGIPFVRYMKAMVQAKGIPTLALMIAKENKQWNDQTPEVAQVLMAAVAAGDTTTAGWASELVYNQNIAAAFLEYLRPQTILGKIQGFTQVPFNVRWGTQTGGATGYWVGQGAPVPVSKLSTGAASLGIAKAAGLVVLDKELVMSSSPSAEVLVRNDLSKTIAQFLDVNFIAPDYAAVANVNPASITNGVDPAAPGGTAAANLRTDAQNLFATADANNLEGAGFVWVTTPKVARAISLMLTSLGQPLYPTVTPEGGTFMGYPLIVSLSAMQVGSPVSGEGNLLVLVHAPSIAMADDGQIVIDASEEASIQMLDNPTNTSTGATTATTMVSMFQTNSVALRATRFINWVKRRTFAVQYIKDAAYTA